LQEINETSNVVHADTCHKADARPQ